MKKTIKQQIWGEDTKILLTGVFGPFAREDEYGSRKDNPMELFHNQVTRVQGPFSLRIFHRTFGLAMIEANIEAACTLLEFPTLERFIAEIKNNSYQLIGISSIIINIKKVKKMYKEIRRYLPRAKIIVGGHITNIDNLDERIDTDYICKGEGIRWFRKFLGQDENAPIKHPAMTAGFGTRVLGLKILKRNRTGVLIPSVGCPMGCNFCSTSALFGGKGNSIVFYKSGDQIFNILCELEKKRKFNSFFVYDENFLLYKKRALRLLELMQKHNKSWSFFIFSSAVVIASYSIEELVRLGITWLWLGLEEHNSRYSKLNGIDTRQLVKKLQSHGINVLGSSIIGLENHAPENIDKAIDYAVSHNSDFHQFMLYTPLPGTPLYIKHKEKNTLLPETDVPLPEIHGQSRFNFQHPHIPHGKETSYLLNAFQEDFKINGPSLARMIRTMLNGWKKYKNHPDKRVVKRIKSHSMPLSIIYAGAIAAMIKYYRTNKPMLGQLKLIWNDLYSEFGLISRVLASLIGLYAFNTICKEETRLSKGWTYEPTVIYEKNVRARKLEKKKKVFSMIKFPVYDYKLVLNKCREQMEAFFLNVEEKFKTSKSKLNSLLKNYHKNLQSLVGSSQYRSEMKKQIVEKTLLQIVQIKQNMQVTISSVQKNILKISDSMSARYIYSQKQINQIRKYIYRNIKIIMFKLQNECRQIKKVVCNLPYVE